ncbi:PLP-dependent cysteine synthase family protein [Oleiharenicola lentus]|uniref:PLP-dependent cysteine synthase family protein n=1 Tax=Oleiharenicola lentus TaxID=2508720 RepID=UPI003F67F790
MHPTLLAPFEGALDQKRSVSIVSTVGNTPLLPLYFSREGLKIFAKCEFLNPSGSVKDRFARCVLDDAERRNLLHPDSHILECSSGNTGIALSMQGAARGYSVTIVISEKASRERRQLIEQFGAKVITFPGDDYSVGVALTRQMAAADSRYFLPNQFANPLNLHDHETITGPEIIAQVPGRIDAFLNGYGTGGTLVGVSRALRTVNPATKSFAVEPAEAALLLGEPSGAHHIEGIADGFIPDLLRGFDLDGVFKVTSDDAMKMAQRLAAEFGLIVGTSSGANITAALEAARLLGPTARVVTLLCDRADRYFSTPLFRKNVRLAASSGRAEFHSLVTVPSI